MEPSASENLGYLMRELLSIPGASAQNERILEIGCGNGDLSAELGRSGRPVVAIDENPATIGAAILRYADMRNVSFRVADFDEIPSDATIGHFSCILSAFTLHHALDIEASVAKLRNMLTPEGRLLVLDFYANHRRTLWLYLFDQLLYGHCLVLPSLIRTIRRIGFSAMLQFQMARLRFANTPGGRQHIEHDRARNLPPTLREWRQSLSSQGADLSIVCGSVLLARLGHVSASEVASRGHGGEAI